MTKDNRLKILQVGSSNWSEKQEIPENMKWYYCSPGQIETLQETIEEDEGFHSSYCGQSCGS